MDPATAGLATSVMTVLLTYAAFGAEEFARSVGRDTYEKAKGLVGILKARWAGDKEATENLARFEEKPERYRPVLEDILREKLVQDEQLAAELASLLDQMGPELEIIQQMEEGRGVAGLEAGEMSRGRASVRQDIQRGDDVTGARIDRMGPR